MSARSLTAALACQLFLTAASLWAAKPVDYTSEVRPLLAEKCHACHGALRQQSDLRLDTAALIKQGGASGPAVAPGKADESLLIERVTASNDLRMPPEGEGEALDTEEVALLRRWIDQGAKAPADEPTPQDPRKHWAYLTPEKSPLPATLPGESSGNPIDAFLAARHRQQGLESVGAAPPHVLLRRVYLDLIGLPPTSEQLAAFLADDSPQAYERIVDQLLASERYGERWGRHWMDVWRYSDWSGYRNEIRNSQRHIWRWRDWIIESLNQDKGYDQMVREMLAGDEIAPTDPEVLRATGYLCRSWFKFNRNTWLDSTVEHTAKAFLGTTINCARCHDHKYDPIGQEDYYRLRAVFEAHDVRTDRVPGESDLEKNGLARVVDSRSQDPTYLFVRGNDKQPDKDNPLAPGLPQVLGGALEAEPVELPVTAYYPGLRDWVLAEEVATAEKQVTLAGEQFAAAQSQLDQLSTELAAVTAGQPPEPLTGSLQQAQQERELAKKSVAAARAGRVSLLARIEAEKAKYGLSKATSVEKLAAAASSAERRANLAVAEHALLQAEQEHASALSVKGPLDAEEKKALAAAEKKLAAARKQFEQARAAAEKPGSNYTGFGKIYPKTSTGRRLALAQYITSRQNPLTARVAINHIWLRHFGTPLVENVFDFGLSARRPRHAKLLDFLAVELMENDWSMKHVHRLMVTSEAYRRRSSTPREVTANLQIDPDNKEYWRMNVRRLEAEIVRDCVLYVAGQLDLSMGGPEIDQTQGQTVRRRSVYFRHAYEKQMKFLELFDAASVNECYRRSESIVPQQALALANSQLSLRQARILAADLHDRVAGAENLLQAFVDEAFRQILTRNPTSKESSYCLVFLAEQAKLLSEPGKLTSFAGGAAIDVKPSTDPAQRARENLVHVLLNHNDFVTVR